MTAKEVFDRYQHFDKLWSDREWMCAKDPNEDDGGRLARMMSTYVYDLWAAVKDAAKETS